MAHADDGPFVLASDYDALAARCAELEKDAARYRWLKDRPSLRISWYRCGGKFDPVGHLGDFDSLIDAEMQPDADGERHGS